MEELLRFPTDRDDLVSPPLGEEFPSMLHHPVLIIVPV